MNLRLWRKVLLYPGVTSYPHIWNKLFRYYIFYSSDPPHQISHRFFKISLFDRHLKSLLVEQVQGEINGYASEVSSLLGDRWICFIFRKEVNPASTSALPCWVCSCPPSLQTSGVRAWPGRAAVKENTVKWKGRRLHVWFYLKIIPDLEHLS